MSNLIAKPVVKDQFWIVTDGSEKVGNVVANGSGFELKLNGSKSQHKNTNAIKKYGKIEFASEKYTGKSKQDLPFSDYPTTKKIHNSVLDIKRKLHLFTKTPKSKCYYAAGWYVLKQGSTHEIAFCPKYIFIQRYEYSGPYKTEDEAKTVINSL